MFSVALIGPDGAGKTTIARMLEERSPLPLKYIYMGVNIAASNFALPTSRLFEYLRGRQNGDANPSQREGQTSRQPRRWSRSAGKLLWATGKLANHLADEWYRQLWSWGYQCSGYIALYDRHFLFDFSLDNVDIEEEGFDVRMHRWFLTNLYPRPNLVIYLDAPAEVLFARKGEKDIENLQRRRQAFTQLMRTNPDCFVVDGTQPLSKVYDDVAAHIFRFYRIHSRKSIPMQKEKTETMPPAPPDPDRLSESTR
jgi:thymidylate kinase